MGMRLARTLQNNFRGKNAIDMENPQVEALPLPAPTEASPQQEASWINNGVKSDDRPVGSQVETAEPLPLPAAIAAPPQQEASWINNGVKGDDRPVGSQVETAQPPLPAPCEAPPQQEASRINGMLRGSRMVIAQVVPPVGTTRPVASPARGDVA